MKKISIIVPVYNVEKYVEKCIQSLINQSYKNIEIILVDDGSNDRSNKIIDEYAKVDSRILTIHQKNKGVSAARNAGLKVATGEYVGFVDPDDYVDYQMYETMLKKIELNMSDLAVCGFSKVTELSDKEEIFEIKDELLSPKKCVEDLFDFRGGYAIKPSVWNKLFRRDKIGDLKFDENIGISEDLKFVVQYILKCNSIVYVKQAFYKNLQRDGSITRSKGKAAQIIKTVEIDNFVYDEIKKIYPDLREVVLDWIVQDNRGWYGLVKQEDAEIAKKMKKMIMRNRWRIMSSKRIYWKEKVIMLVGWFY